MPKEFANPWSRCSRFERVVMVVGWTIKGWTFRKDDLDSLRKSGKGILGGGKSKGEDVEEEGSIVAGGTEEPSEMSGLLAATAQPHLAWLIQWDTSGWLAETGPLRWWYLILELNGKQELVVRESRRIFRAEGKQYQVLAFLVAEKRGKRWDGGQSQTTQRSQARLGNQNSIRHVTGKLILSK